MILKRLSTALAFVFALAGLAAAQVPDCRTQANPTGAHICRAFSYLYLPKNANSGVHVSGLRGAFLKSVTASGLVTLQAADGTESTVQLGTGGGGATVTAGTADPTGGSAGDAYLQVDASNEVQSIWRNVSGTWTEYTVPTAGTSTDDQTAAEVPTDTTNFDGWLGSEATVQAALDALDDATAIYVGSTPATQNLNFITVDVTPNFVLADRVVGATVLFKTPSTWSTTPPAALQLTVDASGTGIFSLPGDESLLAADLSADTAYVATWNGTRWQAMAALLKDNQVTLEKLAAAARDRIMTAAERTKLGGIAENATATFIADSDTPSAYTSQARRLTRVNAGETALEFVNEPANSNTIPHVGRLPDVADDSPVLVFLTHDESSGNREDATFDVAQSGTQCGYSDGSIFNAFGAINKPSPIAMIFGVVDGGACNLSTIHSFNEGFIDDIRFIAYRGTGTCQLGAAFQEYGAATKRIISCSDLQSVPFGDMALNFIYEDGTAYWNDGSVEHRAGLYEKVGTPAVYHDLAPAEEAHKTGTGSAACSEETNPPTALGQICVSSGGDLYAAFSRSSIVTTPASITVAGVSGGFYVGGLYETDDLENRNNLTDGEFIWLRDTQEFYQYQDPDFEVVTWTEAWQYVVDDVEDTAATQAFLASVFLGEFASQAEVVRDRDGYTNDTPTYYFLYFDFGTLIQITAFTHSVTEAVDAGLGWRGPFIIPEEVLDVVMANPTGAPDEPLDTLLVGSRRYSAIVRPGSNGQLRSAAASDYNATGGYSNVIGFDGLETVRAARRATSAATGTWTTVPSGSAITGTIFRWRGTHYQDYTLSGPVVLDVYYNRHSGCRRYYVGRWEACSFSTIFAGTSYLGEHFSSQQAATDHASANGDYAIITENGVPHLQILSDFVAAGTYDYYWTPTFTHQRLPDPIAIEYPFPAIGNANDNLFYAHRTADNHNHEVGFPARGTGDVWSMDVGVNVIAGDDNDQYGFVSSQGDLSPSGSNIGFIYWRDSGTESEQNIQVRFEDSGLIDNTLADGDLRIRYQRHHDVDQYADETEWVTHELNRRTPGDNNHWETGNITTNPFDHTGRDFWIAFEYDADGTWTRYAHGPIARFQRLLDDHDLADHDDDSPTATNSGNGSSRGTSGRLARADHRHDGPGYVHRRHNLNTQNAFMGTGITLHQGSVVYGVAQDGGDIHDYVYVATYAHLLTLDDATVGAQPTENNGGVAGNSFRPESHLTGTTNANFMFGVTSGDSPQLLISRLRGTHDTPTHVDLYVFGGQGGSTGTSGGSDGDDAYDWATEGNDDPIPLAKLANAPAGDITAITTPSNSGIDLDGCNTGDCEVSLDVDGMLSLNLNGLSANDDVIVADGATEYKATLANLANYALGRIDNLTDATPLDRVDKIVVIDDGEDAPRDARLDTLSNFIGARLAGDNLTYNATTNQLDAEAGGGGSGTAEVLYDNTSGTPLTRAAGAWTWANDLKFPLSRALTAADDGGLIELEVTFTATRTTPAPSVDITRSFSIDISPRQFRDLPSNDLTTGTTLTANFIHAFGIRARESDPTFGTASRNSIVTRQRHTDGHDVFRFIMNTDGDTVALSDIRARVVLIAGGRTGGGGTVAANPAGVDAADTRLTSVTIGGTNYNTADVVLPDVTTGVLRAPVAEDFNATSGSSRVLAFDGVDLYRAGRQLTGAHTASATFTLVAEGSTIDGDTSLDCVWRGFHHRDGLAAATPAVNDCYYNTTDNKWRRYYTNGWFDVTSYVVFSGIAFQGLWSSETEALAHVTGNGQYVGYTTNGSHGLYLTSAFVAGAAGHYVYVWQDAKAGLAPDLPSEQELHSSETVTEDAQDWVAFALDHIPDGDSTIELRLKGGASQTVIQFSAGAWLGLTAIPAAQVTDSDDDDAVSNTTGIRFTVYQATTIVDTLPTPNPCVVGRQSNTSLLIGCGATNAYNMGVEIVEIP